MTDEIRGDYGLTASVPTVSGAMSNAELTASLQAYALGIRLFGLDRIAEMMATNTTGYEAEGEVSSNTHTTTHKGEDQ